MKRWNLIWLLPAIIFSCRQGAKNSPEPAPEKAEDTAANFFPITTYLKGQLVDIRNLGINPISISIKNGKEDSTWMKIDELAPAVAAFLTPVIDTANLKGLFSQNNFLDQTVNAFTFTYDSIKALPAGFQLKHWDVYVNPETNQVKRIYMVKDIDAGTRELLTWQGEEGWCKIVRLKHNNGADIVTESEKKITWKY